MEGADNKCANALTTRKDDDKYHEEMKQNAVTGNLVGAGLLLFD